MLLCTAMFPAVSSAYDWSNDYGVFATLERDDNFRLTERDPVATTSTEFELLGELRGASEISNLRLGVSATTLSYSEPSIEDSDDYYVFLQFKRRGERWFGTLDASYYVTPTTETELTDTGNRVDGERKTVNFGPGVNYQLDELNSVYANFVVNDVSYDTVSFTGYTDNAIAVGWVHGLSDISEISLNGSVSEYDPESGDGDDDITTVTGFNIGYGYNASERTRYDFQLGVSERESPVDTNRDGNSSIEISHKIDDRNGFSLFAGNGYVSSGGGEVRYESQLNLRWDHALTERLQFLLSSEAINSEDRDYLEVVAGGSYQITNELRLTTNYRYRSQNSDFGEADSNSVMVSLYYSPAQGWRHEP